MKAVVVVVAIICCSFLFIAVDCYYDSANRPRCWTCQPSDCIKDENSLEWVPFGDYLYALLKEQGWQQDAEKRCIELGGHLASIHSKEENDFVHNLRGNHSAWIGRNKIANPGVNGTFEWTDGKNATDFAVPWDKRQPNEKWTDCIFMANRPDNSGEWSDYFCDQNIPPYYTPNPPFAVCKKSKTA